MTPSTRSQTTADPCFIAICGETIEPKILNRFLKQAEGISLVHKRDLSSLISDDSDDAALKSIETFSEDIGQKRIAITKFFDAAASKDGISSSAIVILDARTTKDRRTCLVIADARKDKFRTGEYMGFRCVFTSALAAVNALETGRATLRELRDEAVLAGGTWDKETLEEIRSEKSSLDMSKFPPSKDWDTKCAAHVSGTRLWPVFRTADISKKALNSFIKDVYNQDWGDGSPPRAAFITSLSPPFVDGPAEVPIISTPELPSELLNASPKELDKVLRSQEFLAEASRLHYNHFIIMDSITERDRTVIIASNAENDGELVLARCEYKQAILCLVAPGSTGLTLDREVDGAMQGEDGVIREP